ncbi:hypothetical protein [Cryptosporangium japonicum]|uniref:Uncharacterized protein n=1 Tax=Cryptosporangium japonicum TaxID=80872 RepID=A0ABN0UKL0_9ACTN
MVLAEVIPGLFSAFSEDALFTLSGAVRLLNGTFELGRWEVPVLVTRGRGAPGRPDGRSIDAELDRKAHA